MEHEIVVKGAREHNLKNVDVKIPRDRLVVITGLSGSGKSSLAFDTIYAEGQRRYVESLSAYARQFLDQNRKPDVDSILGLSPAISIEQKSTSRNPRSTVGTLTEIYDYLRLLYARVGQPHCPKCGKKIEGQTVQQIVDQVLTLPEGSRLIIAAPIIRGRKGEYRKEMREWLNDGFGRIFLDGEQRDLSDDIILDKNKKHDIDLIVDRLVLKEGIRQRLTESVELALKKAEGLAIVALADGERHLYSQQFSCVDCGVSVPELEPRMFSFNSPHGACPTCDGLGISLSVDEDKLIDDQDKSIAGGAIKPMQSVFAFALRDSVWDLSRTHDIDLKKPWKALSQKHKNLILHGTKSFEGVSGHVLRRWRAAGSDRMRDELQSYLAEGQCDVCNGYRLKPEARSVKVADLGLHDVCDLSISECAMFFKELSLPPMKQHIADRVLREVRERLEFLSAVGLEYLSLGRSAGSLSGGEAQRIRLATQIGSALQGVIYVLDEPSIGLHQRDNDRLLRTLKRLRDLGNTVLVVEHDEDTMRAADHIVDLGPGAGRMGGTLVAEGTAKHIESCKNSMTGDYLSGRKKIPVPKTRRSGNGHVFVVHGAHGNNLRGIDVSFPAGTFICVTGVSGSGKSTLVNETLFPAVVAKMGKKRLGKIPCKDIVGADIFDQVIDIDQSPIGRTPRSNPATYTQAFQLIRDLFAELPESKVRGYAPGRYSFNVKGGRCDACEGDGIIRIEMHFLPDVFVICDTCQGSRYNRETLEVTFKGKSIADVLMMTVDEAAEFLSAIPRIRRKLETLQQVGLGYIQLGQSATTLSGGEAQRIKLSRELSKRPGTHTLYILDEPTTGLHFYDVHRLVGVLQALVDVGHTVVVIEHNLDVIKTADYIIDLGPEGGSGGGQLVVAGTPEQVAKSKNSYTGRFLKPYLV